MSGAADQPASSREYHGQTQPDCQLVEKPARICYIVQSMQNVQINQLASQQGAQMEKIIKSSVLRSQLSPILDEVQFNRDNYIIERNGRPAAVIVPLDIYENWKQNRQRFFDTIRQVQQANQDADPDEVMELVLQAQQAIRSESAATS